MSLYSDLNPMGALCVGSLSSLCAVSIWQPASAIKNHLMTGKGFPRLSLALYRGLSINILCDQTNQPLAFAINQIYYQYILQGRETTMGEKIMGGFISGTLVSPLLSLCERIMIIQQLQENPITKEGLSITQVIKKIKEIEGMRGFTKGVSLTIGREGINATCFFGIQKSLTSLFTDLLGDKEQASAIAFIISGTLAGALTTPFDLSKTIIQSDLDKTRGNYLQKIKASLLKESGSSVSAAVVQVAKSCLARMLLMSGLLGTLGIASTYIPKCLPKIFFKQEERFSC